MLKLTLAEKPFWGTTETVRRVWSPAITNSVFAEMFSVKLGGGLGGGGGGEDIDPPPQPRRTRGTPRNARASRRILYRVGKKRSGVLYPQKCTYATCQTD